MENTFDKLIVLVIVLNIMAYLIKYILKTKGYPVAWFSKHLRDIPNLWRLIKKTQNTGERILYLVLGTSFPLLTVVFIISAFSQMKDFGTVDWCEYEKQFRQTEWQGIVTKKYIDNANHAYETIEIDNNGKLRTIQNWVIFQNGNFEQIEIGDSIVKELGVVNLKLYRQDVEIELVVDYGCDESINNNR